MSKTVFMKIYSKAEKPHTAFFIKLYAALLIFGFYWYSNTLAHSFKSSASSGRFFESCAAATMGSQD